MKYRIVQTAPDCYLVQWCFWGIFRGYEEDRTGLQVRGPKGNLTWPHKVHKTATEAMVTLQALLRISRQDKAFQVTRGAWHKV